MTNAQFTQEIGKAKIDKVLKFVFTELSNFIDWYSEGNEINEHYQGELYLLFEKILPCKQEDMFIQAEREEKKRKQLELWGGGTEL